MPLYFMLFINISVIDAILPFMMRLIDWETSIHTCRTLQYVSEVILFLRLLNDLICGPWFKNDGERSIVVNNGATWRTFQPQAWKTKKNLPWKYFLHYSEIFFFIFRGWNFLTPSLRNPAYFFQTKNLPWKNFLYFSKKKLSPHFRMTVDPTII